MGRPGSSCLLEVRCCASASSGISQRETLKFLSRARGHLTVDYVHSMSGAPVSLELSSRVVLCVLLVSHLLGWLGLGQVSPGMGASYLLGCLHCPGLSILSPVAQVADSVSPKLSLSSKLCACPRTASVHTSHAQH